MCVHVSLILCCIVFSLWPTQSVIHVASVMSRASKELGIPLVVTEQYPKALGHTVHEIDINVRSAVFQYRLVARASLYVCLCVCVCGGGGACRV